MISQDFTIRIVVKGGEQSGLKVVEKTGWIGVALVFPRSALPSIRSREELTQSGVYLLVDSILSGGMQSIYIGEGDRVINRLLTHYREEEFWNEAIVFTAKRNELNRAQIKHLEARLIEIGHDVRRARLKNKNKPRISDLNEGDRAEYEGYLAEILLLLPNLGVRAFTEPKHAHKLQKHFKVRGRGYSAKGWESENGFVVAESSTARLRLTATFPDRVKELRQDLIAEGILEDTGESLIFSKDFEFNSPSLAATMVRGMSTNGRTAWKDSKGITLREHQERRVDSEQ